MKVVIKVGARKCGVWDYEFDVSWNILAEKSWIFITLFFNENVVFPPQAEYS